MRVPGERSRTLRMQSTKCPAPPSRRSSRSTLVITTYFSARRAMVSPRWRGSSGSSGLGPGHADHEIEEFLRWTQVPFRKLDDVAGETAAILAQDRIVG